VSHVCASGHQLCLACLVPLGTARSPLGRYSGFILNLIPYGLRSRRRRPERAEIVACFRAKDLRFFAGIAPAALLSAQEQAQVAQLDGVHSA
jgi:hypothetical protein